MTPLTPRDCADYMGRSVDYIHKCIREKHLRATLVRPPGAKLGRWLITEDDFATFLESISWPRLPKRTADQTGG